MVFSLATLNNDAAINNIWSSFIQQADKTQLPLHCPHSNSIALQAHNLSWTPIWDSKLALYRGICTHFLWSVLKHWVETQGIWVVTLATHDFWQATSSSSAWFSSWGKELITLPLSNCSPGLFRLLGEELDAVPNVREPRSRTSRMYHKSTQQAYSNSMIHLLFKPSSSAQVLFW